MSKSTTNNPDRIWRRTIVTRKDGTIAPLPDNWSLIDIPTGIAVAQLRRDTGYQDRPTWRVICRSLDQDGVLIDRIMTWIDDPTQARQYCEAQTYDLMYKIKRKRTTEEILGRPPRE